MSRLMMLDMSFWNRSSGMTSELSDSISLQPFDNFFRRIRAFTSTGENPGVVLDLHRLAVCLQKQLRGAVVTNELFGIVDCLPIGDA